MQSGRAVILHPVMSRTPWHMAFLLAAAEFAKYSALTAAVVIGGATAVLLVLFLAVVAAPLGAAAIGWVLWRAVQQTARDARRLTLRARRRARALGLRVVRGAGAPP